MSKKLNLRQKMEEINQRFTHKTKSSYTTELLDSKVSGLQKKLSTFVSKTQTDLEGLGNDAKNLLEKAQTNNIQYEQEAQAQMKELEMMIQEVKCKVERQSQERKQRENMIVNAIEKKISFLHSQIEKEKQQSTFTLNEISQTLKSDVPTLMNSLIEYQESHQKETERLGELLSTELEQSKAQSDELNSRQESNHKKMYELIRDLTVKAKKEVEEEKIIREETCQEILSYVEQNCGRLGEE